MIINILTDNPRSWIMPYVKTLVKKLKQHRINWVTKAKDIKKGDIALLLSCERIVPQEILKRNSCNLVVHPSDLPKGKGWSPLAWQIIEGKNKIPVTLFEAEEELDSGDIYLQEDLMFEGHELNEEIKRAQGLVTIKLITDFVRKYPHVSRRSQKGESTFYKKRTKDDSELDVKKPLVELFNILRVVDNERYPAFFIHRGHKYIVRIEKE